MNSERWALSAGAARVPAGSRRTQISVVRRLVFAAFGFLLTAVAICCLAIYALRDIYSRATTISQRNSRTASSEPTMMFIGAWCPWWTPRLSITMAVMPNFPTEPQGLRVFVVIARRLGGAK